MIIQERYYLPVETTKTLHTLTPQFGYGLLGEVVYFSRYSRTDVETGRQETWADTIIRTVEGNMAIRKWWHNIMGLPWDRTWWDKTASDMAFAMFNFHFLPGGRGLWASGSNVMYEQGSAALNNCAAIDITSENLAISAEWTMNMLMFGVGVGFGITDVGDIEAHQPIEEQTKTIVIGDSREAWSASIRSLIESYLKPQQPTIVFDYSEIRAAGEPIKTFGGISQGHVPLEKLHERIRNFFSRYYTMQILDDVTSYDETRLVADIINAIGACVVAGNIRRSAEIALGRPDDWTFLNLKNYGKWDEGGKLIEEGPSHDRMDIGWGSNNSVVISAVQELQTLPNIASLIRENGEPGILNVLNMQKYARYGEEKVDSAWLSNPCGEVSLESGELCVTGDSHVLTEQGYRRIDSLVGQENIQVYSQFSSDTLTGEGGLYAARAVYTGIQPVIEIKTTGGRDLTLTKNHPILTSENRWVPAGDIKVGDKIVANTVGREIPSVETDEKFYALGHFSGDGWLTLDSRGRTQMGFCAGGHELHVMQRVLPVWESILQEAKDFIETPYENRYSYPLKIKEDPNGVLNTHISKPHVARLLQKKYGYIANRANKKRFPTMYSSWSTQQKISFLRGVFDADGHVRTTPRISISMTAANREFLQDFALALSEFGLVSRICTTFLKSRDREQSILQVRGSDNIEKMKQLFAKHASEKAIHICDLPHSNRKGSTTFTVSEIIERDEQKVYDLVVDEAHNFVVGGLVSHNCNISEVFPTRCHTPEEFFNALRLATIYTSNVSLLPTHSEFSNAVVARNRRIGVGIGGVADWYDTVGATRVITMLRQGYRLVEQTNHTLAKMSGVPPSIRLSVVKPSGCYKEDSLIVTDQGILMFNELVDTSQEGWQPPTGHTVPTRFGSRGITKHFNNGTVPTKRFTTQDGMEIEVSLNHPLLVAEDDTFIWKQARNLSLGDNLVGYLNSYQNETETTLIPHTVQPDGRTKGLPRTPTKMSADLAWFLGLFYGDGSVHEKGIRVACSRKDVALREWIAEFFAREFGISVTEEDPEGWVSCSYVCISSVHLLKWLEMNGLLKQKTAKLRVPKAIRTASHDSIRAFIAGLWRADGGQHNQSTWSVCTISKELAQQVLVLGRAVGFNLKIKCAGPGGWGAQDRWIITSRSLQEANDRYKLKRLRERHLGDSMWLDAITKIENSEALTLDIEVDDVHEYVAQGVVSHNSISQLAGVSSGMHYPVFKRFIRRVRQATTSPVIPLLQAAGIPWEVDTYSDNTLVFEFPQESQARRSQRDISLWQKGSMLQLLQTHWADNMVSNTLTFDEATEGDQIEDFLAHTVPFIKSLSLLPDRGGVYAQMPYEEISEKEYLRRAKSLKTVDWHEFGGSDGEDSRYCSDDQCEIVYK